MKNKPGTVSPANITKYCKLTAGEFNKVEFIYANSTKVRNTSEERGGGKLGMWK